MDAARQSSPALEREDLLERLGVGADADAEALEAAFEQRRGLLRAQVENAGSKPERIAARNTLKGWEAIEGAVRLEAGRLRIGALLEETLECVRRERPGAAGRKLAEVNRLREELGVDDDAIRRAVDEAEGDLEDLRARLGQTAAGGSEADEPAAPLQAGEPADEAAPPVEPPEVPPCEPVSKPGADAEAEAPAPETPAADVAGTDAGEALPAAPEEAAERSEPVEPAESGALAESGQADAPAPEEAAVPDKPAEAPVEPPPVEPPPEEPPPAEPPPEFGPPAEAPPIIADYTGGAEPETPPAAPEAGPAPAAFSASPADCLTLTGPEEERLLVLSRETVVFGRSRDCDVLVRASASDPEEAQRISRKISRAHFTLYRRSDDVEIQDGAWAQGRRKRSANGTFGDGQAIDSVMAFRTGLETLRVTREGDSVNPPSWSLELLMSPAAETAEGASGPQGCLLRRMDGLCEDLLLLWGSVDLRALGLTEEPLVLAWSGGGYGVWDGRSWTALETGFAVGNSWVVSAYGQLDQGG